ncbi:MAG: hypothetical protein Kow0099_00630 [Candidatus Abyssubacteria bacterium]
MRRGLSLFKEGEYRAAIEQFELIIRHDSNYVRAYNNIGYIYRRLGDYDKALEVWEAGLKVDPSYRRLQKNITSLRRVLNNKDEKAETPPVAIEDFEVAVDWLTENAEVSEILEGRFFDVYLIEDGDAKWALKTPGKKLSLGPEFYAKFETACSGWLRLSPNPYVVGARSLEWVHGRPYLVLEYVPEGSLRTFMARGLLSVGQIFEFAIQTCLGMQSIHAELHSAHGDIRPENLLLYKPAGRGGDKTGGKSDHFFLKVSDPGLVCVFGRTDQLCDGSGHIVATLAEEGLVRTPSGFVSAFIHNCAPELFESVGTPTVSSDIFSFGVVLYEMLTGLLPFSAPYSADASREIRPEHPSLINKRVPRELGDIAMRCLEREAGARPKDFLEVGHALVQCLTRFQLSLLETDDMLRRYRKISKFQYLDEEKDALVMIVPGTESSSEVGQVWEVLKQKARRDNNLPLQKKLSAIEVALSAPGVSVGEIYATRESLLNDFTVIPPADYLEELKRVSCLISATGESQVSSYPASDSEEEDSSEDMEIDTEGSSPVELQAEDDADTATLLVEALRLRARAALKESSRGQELAALLDSLTRQELFARQLAALFDEHQKIGGCPAAAEFLKDSAMSSKESVALVTGLMFMAAAEYSAALETFNMVAEEHYLPALDIYLWTTAKFQSEKMRVIKANSLRNADSLLKEMFHGEEARGERETAIGARQARPRSVDAYFLRGLVLEQLGEHKQAIAHFRAWKRGIRTGDTLSRSTLAWCNLIQGKSMYEVGMPSEALLRWQRVIVCELEPPFFEFLEMGIDKPRVMLANYVMSSCEAALARLPENPILWSIKGKLLTCLSHSEEALECAGRAAEVGEDYYPAHYVKMEALLATGRFEEASAALNAYLLREPYDPLSMLRQTEVLCQLGSLEKAIEELKRAIAYGLDLSDLRASIAKKRLAPLEQIDDFKGIVSYLSGCDY